MALVRGLSQYQSGSQLKKAALNLLVRSATERGDQTDEMAQRLKALRRQFLRLDLDGSGCISASELAQGMRDAQMGVEDGVTDKIIAEIDHVGNGKINYTEFLAATLTFGESVSDDMLRRLFQRFDVDDSGRIS